MRLLATADLHYNHPRSRESADEVIDRINRESFDVLLLVGDTAAADGDALEQCLARFTFTGPKLFVAGNHELWTHGDDSYRLFREELPRRCTLKRTFIRLPRPVMRMSSACRAAERAPVSILATIGPAPSSGRLTVSCQPIRVLPSSGPRMSCVMASP